MPGGATRIVYWDKFGRPDLPEEMYIAPFPDGWWLDEKKAARIGFSKRLKGKRAHGPARHPVAPRLSRSGAAPASYTTRPKKTPAEPDVQRKKT